MSLGKPETIRQTLTGTVHSEQWIYSRPQMFVYFDNDKVTAVQN